MAEYWDVKSFRKTKSGKTFAIAHGSAKQREDGGFNLYLHSFPAPDPASGQFCLVVSPPYKGGRGSGGGGRRQDEGRAGGSGAAGPRADLDDEIPF